MNVSVVQTQYFKDLDTHLVYIEPRNSYNKDTKHNIFYNDVLVERSGWLEVKDPSLLQVAVQMPTRNACYADSESGATMTAVEYNERCKELTQQAFDDYDEDDNEKIVIDAHAYSLLKELKKWHPMVHHLNPWR